MRNWLCMKNGVVVNIVHADETFMQINSEIKECYDSYMDADVGESEIKIGSCLEDGKWKHTLISQKPEDYSNLDLTGRSFRDHDLTGCSFSGANITDCNFRGVAGNFSLVGAIWNKKTIQRGPVFIKNPYYFCMVTDVFTIMGCVIKPTDDVILMTIEEGRNCDNGSPEKPDIFWQHIKDDFITLVKSWSENPVELANPI